MKTLRLVLIGLMATGLAATFPIAREAGAQEEERVIVQQEEVGHHVEMQAVVIGDDGQVMRWHSSGDGTPIVLDADGQRTLVLDPAKGLGWIGVRMTGLTPELRDHFGAGADRGLLVAEVVAGGPAEIAGIQVGDVIVEIDGQSVASAMKLATIVRRQEDGTGLPVSLIRDGAHQNLRVTVVHREAKRVFVRGGSRSMTLGGASFDSDEEIVGDLATALVGVRELLAGDQLKAQVKGLSSFDWTSFDDRLAGLEARIRELEGELEACQER